MGIIPEPILILEDDLCWLDGWNQLMLNYTLFDSLEDMVRKKDRVSIEKSCHWINNCKSYQENENKEQNNELKSDQYQANDIIFMRQWNIARKLVACAYVSIDHPNIINHELDRVDLLNTLCEVLPENMKGWFTKDDIDLVWAAIRHFITPLHVRREFEVPIALTIGPDEQKTGLIAKLKLSVLKGGCNVIIRHPGDAIRSAPHEDFITAMGNAWATATQSVDGTSESLEGYWRVVGLDDQSLGIKVAGESAGGAALLGWQHALQGKINPDPRIIVLAKVEGDQLAEVGGVAAKAQAIGEYGQIDTIVVANDKNSQEAVDGLMGLGYTETVGKPDVRCLFHEVDRVAIRIINFNIWAQPETLNPNQKLAVQGNI